MPNAHSRTKRLAVGIATAVVGFAAAGSGVALATGAFASSDPVVIQGLPGASQSPPPTYSTNANRQTYGSLLNSTSSATDPVLARVIATNGATGYVYTSQLNQSAASPGAAVAQQSANATGRYIPVYAQDGTTVIGQFEASEPHAATLPETSPTTPPTSTSAAQGG